MFMARLTFTHLASQLEPFHSDRVIHAQFPLQAKAIDAGKFHRVRYVIQFYLAPTEGFVPTSFSILEAACKANKE